MGFKNVCEIKQQQLQQDVKNGQIELVKSMLPTIDASIIKIPILHHALNNKEMFSVLMEQPFKLDILNENGKTVLYLALLNKNQYYIETIMAKYKNKCNAYQKLKDVIKSQQRFAHVTSAAAYFGLLDIIIYCHDNNKFFSSVVLDYAAENGQLDVIKWCIKNRVYTQKYKNDALNVAAEYGHLDIVKFLFDDGCEQGCVQNAMNKASRNVRLNVVKWLYENYRDKCTKECIHDAMDTAAANGHLDILQWLHENGQDFTTSVLNCAANLGRLNIVKYLVENVKPVDNNNEWNIEHVMNISPPHVIEYFENKLVEIEKEYFDELSNVLYNNFIESNENNKKNHYQEIIKKVVNTHNVTILAQFMKLPRYNSISTEFIINYALSQKLHAFIKEYCNKNNYLNTFIDVLLEKY